MKSYLFSQFLWSRENLVIDEDKSYKMRDLTVEPVGERIRFGRAEYFIKHTLTGELICCVGVETNTSHDFKLFHNAVIESKLDALRH